MKNFITPLRFLVLFTLICFYGACQAGLEGSSTGVGNPSNDGSSSSTGVGNPGFGGSTGIGNPGYGGSTGVGNPGFGDGGTSTGVGNPQALYIHESKMAVNPSVNGTVKVEATEGFLSFPPNVVVTARVRVNQSPAATVTMGDMGPGGTFAVDVSGKEGDTVDIVVEHSLSNVPSVLTATVSSAPVQPKMSPMVSPEKQTCQSTADCPSGELCYAGNCYTQENYNKLMQTQAGLNSDTPPAQESVAGGGIIKSNVLQIPASDGSVMGAPTGTLTTKSCPNGLVAIGVEVSSSDEGVASVTLICQDTSTGALVNAAILGSPLGFNNVPVQNICPQDAVDGQAVMVGAHWRVGVPSITRASRSLKTLQIVCQHFGLQAVSRSSSMILKGGLLYGTCFGFHANRADEDGSSTCAIGLGNNNQLGVTEYQYLTAGSVVTGLEGRVLGNDIKALGLQIKHFEN